MKNLLKKVMGDETVEDICYDLENVELLDAAINEMEKLHPDVNLLVLVHPSFSDSCFDLFSWNEELDIYTYRNHRVVVVGGDVKTFKVVLPSGPRNE